MGVRHTWSTSNNPVTHLRYRSQVNVAEMFLPRRMAFVYNLGSEDEPGIEPLDSDMVPTTLRRSKTDCPQVRSSNHIPSHTCADEHMNV